MHHTIYLYQVYIMRIFFLHFSFVSCVENYIYIKYAENKTKIYLQKLTIPQKYTQIKDEKPNKRKGKLFTIDEKESDGERERERNQ